MDNERIRIHGKKIRFPKTIETNSIESNNYSKKPQVISLPIVVILVLIMSSLSGAAGAYFIISSYKSNVTTTNGITTSTTPLNETNSISNAVSKVYDATVVLEVYKDKELISTGTGFVYKKENGKAYLMTNNHVVNGGDEIKILFTDSTETKAEVVGKDTYSDIAVLTVKDSTSITAATLGASKKSRVGDTIFAVGSPEGSDYAGTVTKGILSARERLIEVALSNSNETDYYMQVLQTDAAINPGNSGGPLCNTNGEVIGITNMKLVDDTVEGMGFAIPIEDAIKVSALLEKEGKITRPYIGISMLDLTNSYYLWQAGIMLPEGIKEGIAIYNVEPNSPASTAGLKKGDIITKLNNKKVGSLAEFRYELYKNSPGDTIEVTYYRNNKEQTTKLTLGKNEQQ